MIGAECVTRPAIAETAWNIGPQSVDVRRVSEVIDALAAHWKRPDIVLEPSPLEEARLLTIDATRARTLLGWQPAWAFDETLERTAHWYRRYYDDRVPALELCAEDLDAYRCKLAAGKIASAG